MPKYKTHVSVNLFLGLPLSLAAMKYTVQSAPQDTLIFAGAFIYGTFFLHPDVDLARKIRLFSLKGLFTFPFRSYSLFFRHRGISHTPVIGTLTRILWLIGFCWIVFFCFNWAFPDLAKLETSYLCFGVCGLIIADLFHFILDQISA